MARLIPFLALGTSPAVALADPISLISTALVQWGGLSSIAAFAVTAGAALLGSANARRKQRRAAARQRDAYNASLQDRSVTLPNAEAPWQIVYGSPAPVGGTVVAILTSGDRDQLKHLVIVYAAHECHAIDEIYIDGVPVGPLDGSGWCTGGEFYEYITGQALTEAVAFDGSGVGTLAHTASSLISVTAQVADGDRQLTVEYAAGLDGTTITAPGAAGMVAMVTYNFSDGYPRVNVQKHLSPGGVDTADAFLMAAVPDKWTSAHKLSGFTYIVLTLDLNAARFQGGPPNPTAKMRGKKLYDFRTATTAYSANPALCVADYLASSYGYGAGTSLIDSAAVIAAANACDSQGFNAHGILSTGSDRDSNLQQLEDSMAGATHFSGGVWRIMAGAWSTPVMTLTEADLATRIEVVQASEPADKRYVGARGTYAPAGGVGVPADITPYGDVSPVPGVLDMQFPFTGTNAECQKLAGIAVERSKLGETIIFPAHLSAWKLQPGDRTTVNNAELGYVGKTFRVVDWSFSASAPVGLVMTEDTAAVWTGTSSATEPVDATSNLTNPFTRPPAPAGLTAASGTDQLIVNGDGTISTRVLVQWSAPTLRAVLQGGSTQLQWRLSTVTDDLWQSVALPPDATSQYLTGVEDGTVIVVRVRHINGLSVTGDWTNLAHRVLGKSEPPSNITALSIAGKVLSWDDIPDIDKAGYIFRFHYGTNFDWGSAAPLHTGLIVASPFEMLMPPAGPVTIMGKGLDTSGNESRDARAVVTDLGDPDVANVLEAIDLAAAGFPGQKTNCTVSAGDLVADATDSFYGTDTQSFFGPDTESFFKPSGYTQMTYVSSEVAVSNALAGSTGTLTIDADGIDLRVEYRMAGAEPYFGADADSFYGPDSEPHYSSPGPWQPWPGSLEMKRDVYQFRVTIGAGTVQGVLRELTLTIDAPDIVETLDDVVIAAGGTTLTLTKPFTLVKNVQATLQTNGSGAETIEVTKTPPLTVVARAFNNAHTAVSGATADFTVKGY